MTLLHKQATYQLELNHPDGYNGHTCDAYVVRIDGELWAAFSYEAVARTCAERLNADFKQARGR